MYVCRLDDVDLKDPPWKHCWREREQRCWSSTWRIWRETSLAQPSPGQTTSWPGLPVVVQGECVSQTAFSSHHQALECRTGARRIFILLYKVTYLCVCVFLIVSLSVPILHANVSVRLLSHLARLWNVEQGQHEHLYIYTNRIMDPSVINSSECLLPF